MNLPLHCCGCHTNCSLDFCKTAQQRIAGNTRVTIHEQVDTTTTTTTTTADETTSTPTTNGDTYNTIQAGILLHKLNEHQYQLLPLDMCDIMADQEQTWVDATTDDS